MQHKVCQWADKLEISYIRLVPFYAFFRKLCKSGILIVALEYLHNGCNPPIIHRDVKTENILLNEKLQAKVADFGWSKSMPVEGGSYVSTAIVGTPGYLDPE